MVHREDTHPIRKSRGLRSNKRDVSRAHNHTKCIAARLSIKYDIIALCLHPFLRTLEEKLPGIRLSRNTRNPSVVAYADDVTVFVTQPGDFAIIQDAVECYEKATGAKLNSRKSQALPVGGWSQPATELGIAFHDHVTILGITYGNTISKSIKKLLGKSSTVGKSTGKKSICSNPLPRTADRVCTPMSSCKNVVSSANSPTHQGARATTYNRVYLVHLARGNLSGTCVHPTTS